MPPSSVRTVGKPMPLPPLEPPEPKSVLIIESDRTLALKLQDLLFSLFHETLDLAMACSLREGMTYLSTRQVPLILIDLGVSDYKKLDAVRALRVSARGSALIAYGAVVHAPLHLDALRAGAHEVLSLADASTDTFRLIAERAMVRAVPSQLEADSPRTAEPIAVHPRMLQLAHDLNNALTAINGLADILLTRLRADEPARACAEQIKKSGTQAAALVNTLTHPDESSPAAPTSNPAATAQAA